MTTLESEVNGLALRFLRMCQNEKIEKYEEVQAAAKVEKECLRVEQEAQETLVAAAAAEEALYIHLERKETDMQLREVAVEIGDKVFDDNFKKNNELHPIDKTNGVDFTWPSCHFGMPGSPSHVQ